MVENVFGWVQGLPPQWQALIGGGFTLTLTSLGALIVVVQGQHISERAIDTMLGFASGVMLAASYFSLLAPALDYAESQQMRGWFVTASGFLLGAGFIYLGDMLLPHLHRGKPTAQAEGLHTQWRRSTLLILAITLHNVPEGLAVGVAFGAAAHGGAIGEITSFSSAAVLALGIGIQNFPEGIAVAEPLRAGEFSRAKSFLYGSLSAAVEPLAAVLGASAVSTIKPLLPYGLAFAAGAMVYVVVEELIPEAHDPQGAKSATVATVIGFVVMMSLDVALA